MHARQTDFIELHWCSFYFLFICLFPVHVSMHLVHVCSTWTHVYSCTHPCSRDQSFLLCHSLLYSLIAGSLPEPGAKMAASKPLDSVGLQANVWLLQLFNLGTRDLNSYPHLFEASALTHWAMSSAIFYFDTRSGLKLEIFLPQPSV